MTPNRRKFILAERGISQRFIASEEGVTIGAVNNLLHDRPRTKSKRLCRIIAEKYMGLPVDIVWPAWFKNEFTSTLNNLPNETVCVNGKP